AALEFEEAFIDTCAGRTAVLAGSTKHVTVATKEAKTTALIIFFSLTYHRVPTSEEEAKRNKRKRSEAAEHIATKIQALAWVAAGGFVMYQTDLPNVMMRDPNVNRVWFNIAAACFAMNCVLCFYLAVWLPYVQRIHIEWSVYCPRVIPTMTIVGVMCSFSFDPASYLPSESSGVECLVFFFCCRLIRGLWPVWGLLTPLILALTFMACIMSLHFIPWPL
ncbi:hypothetical protein CTAYLR_010319, partial [Chrysophaeum taylorii]